VTAPPADGSSPPELPLLDGRYAIGEAIGRGRSTVHRAEDRRLRRQVAIKEVRLAEGQEGAERARLRALREAQAAARLDNPGVVTVYDVVEEAGSIWLVMELVDAPSLAQVVADDGPLDHARAARIGLGVLGALEAAHAVGIVHRDVKPANVLVLRDDRTKLADFGVATIRDESRVTATGTIVGSPSYMAPEQAMAAEVGPFTDLWALGATLYYAVEGKPPFAGDSPLATASAVVHGDPRPPQSRGPLIGLLQRLLEKDPQRRPGSRQVRATLVAASTASRSRAAQGSGTAAAAAGGRDEPAPPGRGRNRGAGRGLGRGRGLGLGRAAGRSPLPSADTSGAPTGPASGGHAGPATPPGRHDPTLVARPSPIRDTRQVVIPPAGQPPTSTPPASTASPASPAAPRSASPTPGSAEAPPPDAPTTATPATPAPTPPASEARSTEAPSSARETSLAPGEPPAASAGASRTPAVEDGPAGGEPAGAAAPAPTRPETAATPPETETAAAPGGSDGPADGSSSTSSASSPSAGSAGGTEVADARGDALPATRAKQAVDEGVAARMSSADPQGGDEPVDSRSGVASRPATATQASPATAVAALAGVRRVGERVSARRSPAVVIAAVVAVVALVAVAAWAAASGGGDGGDDTDGGGRDTSSTTTSADEEASQTTASTTASTAPTTSTTASGGLPAGWTRYEGPNGVYTIAHPAGWQVEPGEQGRVRIRDPESGSYLLIDWTDEPRPDPVADWRTQSQGFAGRHEAYQEIRIEPAHYRDYNAAIWEFRYRDQGVDLHVANLGFVAANRGYALYFQTHEDRWAASKGILTRFRQTFHPG
jgi:hypothetical protein